MNTPIAVRRDYAQVHCLNIPVFVSWLVNFFGAQPMEPWNNEKMLVRIPGFGVCKIFKAELFSLPSSQHLPVEVDSIEKIISLAEEAGIKYEGKEHWRIFSIPDDKGKIIGYIHAARRDKPLE